MVYVYNPSTGSEDQNKSFTIVGVPGEDVTINGDLSTCYDIDGSKFYHQYHEADIMMENAQKEMTEFTKTCQDRIEKGESQIP